MSSKRKNSEFKNIVDDAKNAIDNRRNELKEKKKQKRLAREKLCKHMLDIALLRIKIGHYSTIFHTAYLSEKCHIVFCNVFRENGSISCEKLDIELFENTRKTVACIQNQIKKYDMESYIKVSAVFFGNDRIKLKAII